MGGGQGGGVVGWGYDHFLFFVDKMQNIFLDPSFTTMICLIIVQKSTAQHIVVQYSTVSHCKLSFNINCLQ